MTKLSKMTLEDLWQLFPIIIEQHNPDWKIWYSGEAVEIDSILKGRFEYTLSHVGSTSINGICAKPIVDILLETSVNNIGTTASVLTENSWLIMHEASGRIVLNKGYSEKGFDKKVFHLHINRCGDNKEVVFRDYMNSHPDDAKEYERLKLSLLPKYKNNRDGYTDAKTEFCNSIYKKVVEESKS